MTLAVIENCEGCGVCCHTVNQTPFALGFDGADLAIVDGHPSAIDDLLYYQSAPRSARQLMVDRMLMQQQRQRDSLPMLNLHCPWLVDCRCTNYDHRSVFCRAYKLGGDDCLRARAGAQWL